MKAVEELKAEGLSEEEAIRFLEYNAQNPHIWLYFKKEVERLLGVGATRLSSKCVFENLRNDPTLVTVGEFKVCNDFTPHYARVYVRMFPQHRDKFLFKSCKKSLAQAIPLGQKSFSY